MKRRSFVKRSISASILTPLAFTGLINAAGAIPGGGTETTWFTTLPETESTLPSGTSCTQTGEKIKWKDGGKTYCAWVMSCTGAPTSGYRSFKWECVGHDCDSLVEKTKAYVDEEFPDICSQNW